MLPVVYLILENATLYRSKPSRIAKYTLPVTDRIYVAPYFLNDDALGYLIIRVGAGPDELVWHQFLVNVKFLDRPWTIKKGFLGTCTEGCFFNILSLYNTQEILESFVNRSGKRACVYPSASIYT
jgi:hypothetical protein